MMRMTQMFSRIIVICVNGHDRGMATEYGAQIDQVETCLGGGRSFDRVCRYMD